MAQSQVQDTVSQLEALGWFKAFPDAARPLIEQTIAASLEGSDEPKPFPGLIDYDHEGIFEEGAYADLLKQFAEHSAGLLKPENISEQWETAGEWTIIRFRFSNNGKDYAGDFGYDGPWVDQRFYGVLNNAMADTGTDLRFFILPDGEAGVAPESLYDKAVEQKLTPPAEEADQSLDENTMLGGGDIADMDALPDDDTVDFDSDDTVGTF